MLVDAWCEVEGRLAEEPPDGWWVRAEDFDRASRAYSHDAAINIAKQWMLENYGIPRELSEESRDLYHEKLGLLIDFLWTLHPPESSPNPAYEPRAAKTNYSK